MFILQYMSKLHLGVGMPGNIPEMLSHSAAQATAINADHCISIAKALVREKHSWPGLGEMETQGAQFNRSIMGSGHICRILTDSWHLCILSVYILVFTDILKWCCKSYVYTEKKTENVDKITMCYKIIFIKILNFFVKTSFRWN